MSQTQHIALKLRAWLAQHQEDPATKGFLPLLHNHLLGRMFQDYFGTDYADGDLTHAQLNGLEIQAESRASLPTQVASHQLHNIRYALGPRHNQSAHPDIMLLARDDTQEDVHPFWYARVIDIFHVQVRYTGRMEFLSFGTKPSPPPLQQRINLGWLPFSFVNPADVLRASYLMPAFAYGTTSDRLGPHALHVALQTMTRITSIT
ncbi:hypothetical protein C8Q78DRAFT_1083639 [Trametes maxima]|nr:hypothetical protein C8Q78DRAFT_1083639 [Trametes maxima]